MRTVPAVMPLAVNQAAELRLFVEGDTQSLDPEVLDALVGGRGIHVEALGPSDGIRAAANAMRRTHPHYYFIVDRDFLDQDLVESTWQDFGDPGRRNLLIWRRRELESYFLDAAWMCRSRFVRSGWTKDRIADRVRALSQERIYLDCINLTIARIREGQRDNWIRLMSPGPSAVPRSTYQARQFLCDRHEWESRRSGVAQAVSPEALGRAFDEVVDAVLAGASSPEFGRGNWLHMVTAKEVFHALANEAYTVKDTVGRHFQGPEARKLLARERIADPTHRPTDFDDLAGLLGRAVRAGP